MRQSKHRTRAWILTLIVVLAASCLGAVRTLNRMADQVQAVFAGKADDTTPSIAEDLLTKAGYAWDMTVIARKYLEPLEYAPLENAIQKLENAKTPKDAGEANRVLNVEAAAVQTLLENLGDTVKDTDKAALQKCVVNMQSQDQIIARSSYNDTAAGFNEALDQFPANLFAGIFSIKDAELFE